MIEILPSKAVVPNRWGLPWL